MAYCHIQEYFTVSYDSLSLHVLFNPNLFNTQSMGFLCRCHICLEQVSFWCAWFWSYFITFLSCSGRSIGAHIDSVVLSLVGLGMGATSAFLFIYVAEHPSLHPDLGLALGLIILYVSLVWFTYFRTFSLRIFGFALNALYWCVFRKYSGDSRSWIHGTLTTLLWVFTGNSSLDFL